MRISDWSSDVCSSDLADYAGLPYGKKSDEELAARVPALLGRLVERFQPRLAVIACNTASTIALGHVRAALDLSIVGTVPAIKPAAEMTKRSEEHTSELQSLMRTSYAVFCLKKKKKTTKT